MPQLPTCHIDMYSEPAERRQFEHDPSMLFLTNSFKTRNKLRVDKANVDKQKYVNYADTNSVSSYVARVCFGIHSSQSHSMESRPMSCCSEAKRQVEREFVAFALIGDVSQIDPRFRSNLSFRLCVGKLFWDMASFFYYESYIGLVVKLKVHNWGIHFSSFVYILII